MAALSLIVLVAGISGLVLSLARHGAPPQRPPGSHPGTSPPANPESVARTKAITWVLHQVSRSAVVACDAQICADLQSGGFPYANLLWLGPQSNDPIGSTLVVATAPVRAQFGRRLASVWAPAIIASFGSGNARIDIRLMYPGGAVQYRADRQAAAHARKAADVQLLNNKQIAFSATARAALLAGDVDPRLPLLIAAMAHRHPVRIVDFTDQSPGGGPASLLRSMDLAITGSVTHLAPAAYLGWIHELINAQRAEFRPAWSTQMKLSDGQTVLRIGYGAPSPLSS